MQRNAGVPGNATYRREMVRCGKKSCAKLHGPYWYAYWKQGSRLRKRYIGKHLPRSVDVSRTSFAAETLVRKQQIGAGR